MMRSVSLGLVLFFTACAGEPPVDPLDMPILLSTGNFPVDPGTERTQCMYLPLPSTDEVAVTRSEAHMPPGSHHSNFSYVPPGTVFPQQGLQDCTERLRIFLAGSQWPDLDYRLPAGKAMRIPRGS